MFNPGKVKVCEDYYEEYKECRSFRGKFHQYFIFGHLLDCSDWKKDYDACMKFRKHKSVESLQTVIDDEKKRKIQRLEAHYANDIWEKRISPPDDWNKELPPILANTVQEGFLALKMKELKEKNLSYLEENVTAKSYCTIS